jgi:hypothetical protein
MANQFYTTFLNGLLNQTSAIDFDDAGTTIKAALVDTGTYTFSAAHDFYNDVSAGVIGTPQAIGTKTVGTVAAGVFDGDNVTFTAVTGNSVEAILLYKDTGNVATSPLIGLIDNVASGLPVTPNGGDITITWNAGGILQIS